MKNRSIFPAQTTLGDLVAAIYDTVATTGAHPRFNGALVASEVRERLVRANRLDVISALAATAPLVSCAAVSSRSRRGGNKSRSVTARRDQRVAIAAAG